MLTSIDLRTGRPNLREDVLVQGSVQTSADGKTFVDFAKLQIGFADDGTDFTIVMPVVKPPTKVQAIRIRPGELKHPLVIREIKIESDPPVAVFRYPVEFTVDVSDAPEHEGRGPRRPPASASGSIR